METLKRCRAWIKQNKWRHLTALILMMIAVKLGTHLIWQDDWVAKRITYDMVSGIIMGTLFWGWSRNEKPVYHSPRPGNRNNKN